MRFPDVPPAPPPPPPPRPRAKSLPRVVVEESAPASTGVTKPPPANYARAKWGDKSIEGSGSAFLAVLVALAVGAGAFACGHYLKPPTATELDMQEELSAERAKRIALEARVVALETRAGAVELGLTRTGNVLSHNDATFAAVLEKLRPGVKFQWAREPEVITFETAPLAGSTAAAIQPSSPLQVP